MVEWFSVEYAKKSWGLKEKAIFPPEKFIPPLAAKTEESGTLPHITSKLIEASG